MRLLSLLLLVSSLALGACNAAKIGVVDINSILAQSEHRKKANQEALEVQKIYQYNLDVVQKKLMQYEDRKKAQEYLQIIANRLQNDLQASLVNINQSLLNALAEVIDEQGKEYQIILNKEMVVKNSNEKSDITSAVITEFEKKEINFPARPQKIDNPALP